MAIGMLAVMATAAVLISTVMIVVLLYKQGQLVEKGGVLYIIQIYLVLMAGLQVSSVASNDLVGKLLGYGIFIIALLSIYLKKKNFLLTRILLVLMLMLAPVALFLL